MKLSSTSSIGAALRSALREIGAVAPVLAGAEEEHLDAGLPAFLVGGEHVGFLDAFRIDRLVGRDVRQRPQPVAELGGLLVVEAGGRLPPSGAGTSAGRSGSRRCRKRVASSTRRAVVLERRSRPVQGAEQRLIW